MRVLRKSTQQIVGIVSVTPNNAYVPQKEHFIAYETIGNYETYSNATFSRVIKIN